MSGDSTKVGELFVAVGFELDRGDLKKVEKQTEKFVEKLERQAVIRPVVSHKDQRESMRREAALWKSEQVKRQRIHERMAIQSQSRIGRAAKRVGNFGAGLGSSAVGGLGALGLGFGASQVVGGAVSFNKQLTAAGISSGGTMGTLDELHDRVMRVSDETGLAREEVLAAAAAYTTLTGDGRTASSAMETFARTIRATGSSSEDVAGVAATMSQQFGIGTAEFEKGISILIAGGKAGKIELKDMAGLMASLGASFKTFGDSKGTKGLATLGAAFQVVARNFGSATEAATGLESLMGSLQQHAEKLEEAGVKVFGPDGTIRPMMEIVDDLTSKGFSETKLFDLLGRKEAIAALRALRDNRKAVDDISRSTMKAKDLQKDFAEVSASSAAKAEKAWNRVGNAIDRVGSSFLNFLTAESTSDYVSELIPGGGSRSLSEAAADKSAEAGKLEELAAQAPTGKRGAMIEEAISSGDAVRLQLMNASPNELAGIEARNRLTAQKGRMRGKLGLFESTAGAVRDMSLGVGTGDRLNPAYFDAPSVEEPFRYDGSGGASGPINVTNNVNVTAPPGADGHEIADLVRDEVRRESERTARDIAAAAGQ